MSEDFAFVKVGHAMVRVDQIVAVEPRTPWEGSFVLLPEGRAYATEDETPEEFLARVERLLNRGFQGIPAPEKPF